MSALLLALLLGLAPPDSAEGEAAVDALIEDAARAYDEGRLDEALSQLERARARSPRPSLLFNLAQVHRARGDCAAALSAYRDFLTQTKPDDPNHERARRRRGEMEACIAEGRSTTGGHNDKIAAGAAIVPPAPQAGHLTTASTAPMSGPGEPPGSKGMAKGGPATALAIGPRPPPSPAVTVTAPAPEPRSKDGAGTPPARIAGWTLVGAGAVATGAAAVFLWQLSNALSDLSADGIAWNAEARQREADGQAAARRARFCGAAALVTAGSGATLLYLSPPDPPAKAASPSGGQSAVLMGWSGRF